MLVPQLSDFGLACRVPDFSCQLTSDDVTGTFGYVSILCASSNFFFFKLESDPPDV